LISMHFGASHDEININGSVFDRSIMNDIQKRRLRRDTIAAFDEGMHEVAKSRRAARIARKKVDQHAA
jgi:hypothetical protein